ncbi:PREDICTED: polycomb group protein EMBRYONIC FLOWER 2-like isoform X2 [Ipomoea nil]|uniref:polycomb group protein EMBRYONIC FLOWER 2-like isoform X2 n=1 Tax=Ipomoea nil TaxID=35883 RepID=UPI0009015F60|nr:PREDICTED: polycomb group protein EMBRYONIC FLOWER 2-like isoform X2 [Ipomoea nil]
MDSFFHGFHALISLEEKAAREESFEYYCKAVDLYNALSQQVTKRPVFLNKCMSYVLPEEHKKRAQMIISLSTAYNDESQMQSCFPLFILLARDISVPTTKEIEAFEYSIGGMWRLDACPAGRERERYTDVKFVLPQVEETLRKIKEESLSILFISTAEIAKNHKDLSSFPSNVEGKCLVGKVPFELVFNSWMNTPNFASEENAHLHKSVKLYPYFIQSSCSQFEIPSFRLIPSSEDNEAPLQQLQVAISTQHIHRIRRGSVCFHFSYNNDKFDKTQVAQDFSCPFCSISCLDFEGLKCHFSACHGEFNFKYSVTDDVPDVYVSVNFDQRKSEIADVVDPRAETFIFSSKSLRRRKSQTVVKYPKHAKHISDLVFPTAVNELQHKTDVPESSSAPSARLQNQNWRASVECFDPKKCPLTLWLSPSLSDI